MIKEFQGEFRWLSNFAPVEIFLDEVYYPSVEAAYMSAKSDDIGWKAFCADKKNTPGHIKRTSRIVDLVPNWEEIKLKIMQECIEIKFSQEPYRSKLIATGDEILQEGNRWNDRFWGVCLNTKLGHNHLGRLIMEYRTKLIK